LSFEDALYIESIDIFPHHPAIHNFTDDEFNTLEHSDFPQISTNNFASSVWRKFFDEQKKTQQAEPTQHNSKLTSPQKSHQPIKSQKSKNGHAASSKLLNPNKQNSNTIVKSLSNTEIITQKVMQDTQDVFDFDDFDEDSAVFDDMANFMPIETAVTLNDHDLKVPHLIESNDVVDEIMYAKYRHPEFDSRVAGDEELPYKDYAKETQGEEYVGYNNNQDAGVDEDYEDHNDEENVEEEGDEEDTSTGQDDTGDGTDEGGGWLGGFLDYRRSQHQQMMQHQLQMHLADAMEEEKTLKLIVDEGSSRNLKNKM
ncbi:hypothetical protein HK096_001846, partial [Nowakowskiella sp. JEL0078]